MSLKDGNHIEIYESKRFIAITANRCPNAPLLLADGTEALNKLYELFPPKASAPKQQATSLFAHPADSLPALPDDEVLQRMFVSKHGHKIQALWYGDISAYHHDDSAADMALMNHLGYWCNYQPDRMLALFGQSALAKRDKWQRDDYRERTLNKALEGARVKVELLPKYEYEGEASQAEGAYPEPLPLVSEDERHYNDLTRKHLPEGCIADLLIGLANQKKQRLSSLVIPFYATFFGHMGNYRIQIRQGWEVAPNLWGISIQPSGDGKSTVNTAIDNLFYEANPYLTEQDEVLEANAKALKEHARKVKRLEAKLTKAENELDDLQSQPDDESDDGEASQGNSVVKPYTPDPKKQSKYKKARASVDYFKAELNKLENDKPPTLYRREAVKIKATAERLEELLCQNPEGVVLLLDELSALLNQMKNHETMQQTILTAHTGRNRFSSETRKDAKEGTLRESPKIALTLVGAIPPQTLFHQIHKPLHEGKATADGFASRLQLISRPKVGVTPPTITVAGLTSYEQHKAKALELLRKRIRQATLEPAKRTKAQLEQVAKDGLYKACFDEDALALFDEWHKGYQDKKREAQIKADQYKSELWGVLAGYYGKI